MKHLVVSFSLVSRHLFHSCQRRSSLALGRFVPILIRLTTTNQDEEKQRFLAVLHLGPLFTPIRPPYRHFELRGEDGVSFALF